MNKSGKHLTSGFTVTAYRGDARTLLAFDLPVAQIKSLAGFTIQAKPNGKRAYYLYNMLRFKEPAKHAQVAGQPANSSINAPIQKFRWIHLPGSMQEGVHPFFGPYIYTVTPRYFNDQNSLLPLDKSLSVSVMLKVKPFAKGKVELGFTRGFTQSQAFVRHFGKNAKIQPNTGDLLFDTSQVSGQNDEGQKYTFAQEYEWLGFTAREKILALLSEVMKNKKLRLDVFAYDLNEPDVMRALLTLAQEGRVRIILDNAALHHNQTKPTREDQFEALFVNAVSSSTKQGAAILRGRFKRYSHDKAFIVSDQIGPLKVLTGSTNFSITGVYVNSNHMLIFHDRKVAGTYAQIFQTAWDDKVSWSFKDTPEAKETFAFKSAGIPAMEITFAPHEPADAQAILDAMAARITQEGETKNGNVLFAVMGLDKKTTGPVVPVLRQIHSNENIFSYGISDAPDDAITLYGRRTKRGVLVSGKPNAPLLPPPFNQVPGVGLGHQVHHKFVVCGFKGKAPVAYCGSSNLALGGEEENGDNLLAIHDKDIATVFAIEALGLVDHFAFLDRQSTEAKKNNATVPKAKTYSKTESAEASGWFLFTGDYWVLPYYDVNDLRFVDRELFA
jgi:phosphatidylserine/phosphatidylglycerophosphate/cardiolipin synthase-like enzyme